MSWAYELGAHYLGQGRCSFVLWAPYVEKVQLRLGCSEEFHASHPGKPAKSPAGKKQPARERHELLKRAAGGYHEGVFERVEPGTLYCYRLDGKLHRPDPASRSQPYGVHGASEVAEAAFDWTDEQWQGLSLRDYVLYELHVGTFTREGTFDGVIAELSHLRELGVTAIELMPVAQFPGSRNWGYDGVQPFAVQNSYGGPKGLKRLVDACHQHGLAVVLDVVYNHLGPEGNYLNDFGPYFSDVYHSPWGRALNFDGAWSDDVRRFFIENALYWQRDFHLDGLRLDAIHAIRDFSAVPFLQELKQATQRQAEQLTRPFHLIAESDLDDSRFILPEQSGGYGLDAQWSDDFHHCLHVLVAGEHNGYYTDFGGVEQFAKVLRQGWAYQGDYSKFRKRRHGNSPRLNGAKQFVVCSQNHDQVGNRPLGERLTSLTSFEGLKLAAASVILSPFVPLLFMGEEYGERAPFQFFTSHGEPELVEAVRRGRRAEMLSLGLQMEAADPQSEKTFNQCILNHELRQRQPSNRKLYEFYRQLLRLRREFAVIGHAEKNTVKVVILKRAIGEKLSPGVGLALNYEDQGESAWVLLCLLPSPIEVKLELGPGDWEKLLDSAEGRWGGKGSSLPGQFKSQGAVKLELSPFSVSVWHKTGSSKVQRLQKG